MKSCCAYWFGIYIRESKQARKSAGGIKRISALLLSKFEVHKATLRM